MFPSSALLSLALAAVSAVSAVPMKEQRDASKFTLAFAANVNATGSSNLAQMDRARAAALRSNALARKNGKRADSVSVKNTAVTYTASVGVGSPATDCKLQLIFYTHACP